MFRKPASIIISSLLVVSALTLAFNVQPVKLDYARVLTVVSASSFSSSAVSQPLGVASVQDAATADDTVVLVTTMGNITIELFWDMPITSGNFKNLVKTGVYDGTLFHRVVPNFVIQGGDATPKGITVPPIQDELPNKHSNLRGFVAMAKTISPNSATSQFYININDTNAPNLDSYYSVFGVVIEGMNAVDAISHVPINPPNDGKPLQDVTILKALLSGWRAADSMWVDPASTVFNSTVLVGQKFNVTVWMNIAENVYTYQIGLHYNRTQLKCTRVGFTEGITGSYFSGHTITPEGPLIDTSSLGNGSVLVGESLVGATDFIPGPKSASLIWAEFQILSVPSAGNLSSTFDISTETPANNYVLDFDLNTINLTAYDGNYQFIPSDSMWVDPANVVFSTLNASVGQKFNVTVWMDITESVYAYQIALHYNRTQLCCTRAGLTAGLTSSYFAEHITQPSGPVIDTSFLGNGSVLTAETCVGTDFIPGPKSASLWWVEFQILMVPGAGNLTSKLDISTEYPSDTWVMDKDLKSSINNAVYDGNYLFIGTTIMPPSLMVSISPSSLVVMDVAQSQLFASNVSGGTSPYAYQWYLDDVAVLSATSATWNFTPSSSGPYSVYVNVTDNFGFTAKSNTASLTVNPMLSVNISPTSVTLHVGQSQLFTSNVTGGTSPYSYQWYSDSVPVPGASDATWTFTSSSTGSHSICVEVTDSVGVEATSNNVTITVRVHDVAVNNVTSYKTVVVQGGSVNMSVNVANQGDSTETFNLTSYANTTIIATQSIILQSGNSTTLTFTWNTTGLAKGNYTISAYVLPVLGETDTADNNFTGGWVVVSMIGDLTGSTPGVPDGKCDRRDIDVVVNCFGSAPGFPRWNSNCDITGPVPGVPDGKVDIRDIALVAKHFEEGGP